MGIRKIRATYNCRRGIKKEKRTRRRKQRQVSESNSRWLRSTDGLHQGESLPSPEDLHTTACLHSTEHLHAHKGHLLTEVGLRTEQLRVLTDWTMERFDECPHCKQELALTSTKLGHHLFILTDKLQDGFMQVIAPTRDTTFKISNS